MRQPRAIRNLDNVIKGLLGNKDAAKQFMNDFQTGLVSIAGKLGFHINYEDEARKRLAAKNAAHPVTPMDRETTKMTERISRNNQK